MVIQAEIFWCYALAASFLVWGILGLRFALSVLVANAALASILFLLAKHIALDSNIAIALLLCYPLYWGFAFFFLRFLDALSLPSMSVVLRIILGCMFATAFTLMANWTPLTSTVTLFYATYLSDPAKRPVMIAGVFAAYDYEQTCLDSHATLMRLALGARDSEVTSVLFNAFTRCYGASKTLSEVVQPMFDAGDSEGIAFLMESGLKPSTLLTGSAYKGTALAYAALEAKQPGAVRQLIAQEPDDARKLKYLSVIIDALKQENNVAMLKIFQDTGLTEILEGEGAEQPSP